MTDFNKIITDKITEMENSGTIQKIIYECDDEEKYS